MSVDSERRRCAAVVEYQISQFQVGDGIERLQEALAQIIDPARPTDESWLNYESPSCAVAHNRGGTGS